MNLEGQLLVAMPGIGDPRFDHSVIQICNHDAQGAMEIVLNKPIPNLTLKMLLDQMDIPFQNADQTRPVYLGGPVENQRGFVLHSPEYQSNLQTLNLDCGVSMTATQDILQDIGAGGGPEEYHVALGYAGWGPGQLEGEIARNGWLTVESDFELVFNTPHDSAWRAALAHIGVDPLILSDTAGRA